MKSSLARAALLLGVALLVACGGDDQTPGSTPPPTMQAGTTPEAPVTATRAPQPAQTPGAPRQLSGLFVEPRPTTPSKQAVLPSAPAPAMPEHDGRSVTVYDVVDNRRLIFDAGLAGNFSGERFLYASLGAGGSTDEVWLVDLKTGTKRSLGPGSMGLFIDADTVHISPLGGAGIGARVIYDLKTNRRFPLSDLPEPRQREIMRVIDQYATGPQIRAADGSVLRLTNLRQTPGAVPSQDCKATTDPVAQRRCEMQANEEMVLVDLQDREVLRFRALRAVPSAPGEMLVATSPQCDDGGRPAWCGDVLAKLAGTPSASVQRIAAKGTTNIFAVDIATGIARYIATARYEPDTLNQGNWALSGDAGFIAWTEAYCGADRGKTRVFDRRAASITELDKTLWVELRAGKLGIGEFGARSLVEAATLRYLAVLPEVRGDVRWSDDYRYAAVGLALGHGGLCG